MTTQHSLEPLRSPQDAPPPWHALQGAETVAAVESDSDRGLTEDEVRARRARFGPNKLPEHERRSLLSVFVGQFKSPLIYLLFVAAGIALALGHRNDALVIFTVVLLNSLIGTFQEGRAERSLEALRKLATHKARVVRGGQELIVEAGEVVPGDVIMLEAGDAIPADARLLHGAALQSQRPRSPESPCRWPRISSRSRRIPCSPIAGTWSTRARTSPRGAPAPSW